MNSNKVDITHQNDKGETALDLAFLHNNDAIITQCFLYAKNKGLSLTALMSTKTQELARGWCTPGEFSELALSPDRFFNSSYLLDLKQFIQQELQSTEDTGMELTSI